jgi:hypothetical protein
MTKWKNETEILEAANKAPDKPKGWQGLSDDDAIELIPIMDYDFEVDVEMILLFAKNIEQALKEKNT